MMAQNSLPHERALLTDYPLVVGREVGETNSTTNMVELLVIVLKQVDLPQLLGVGAEVDQ